jgi:hypothetical protein
VKGEIPCKDIPHFNFTNNTKLTFGTIDGISVVILMGTVCINEGVSSSDASFGVRVKFFDFLEST